ncbi:MAG: hypothetical protein C4530_15545 [Desulfobacteraceae bacterium]|nr:MAG: hypothetical protein C4530_15545 [Desulfobacteraceae bacterium]
MNAYYSISPYTVNNPRAAGTSPGNNGDRRVFPADSFSRSICRSCSLDAGVPAPSNENDDSSEKSKTGS